MVSRIRFDKGAIARCSAQALNYIIFLTTGSNMLPITNRLKGVFMPCAAGVTPTST